MTIKDELSAAVASGRFTAIEAAILGAALESLLPWSGYNLLQRVPECSKASFYRALKRLRARRIILEAPNTGGKWTISAAMDNWKNRAGDAPLFSEGTPERLGFSRRMEGVSPATEKAPKPKKRARVKPAVLDTDPRPGVDANGDQAGQQHIADPDGSGINEKESDIWDRTAARLKAANRKG